MYVGAAFVQDFGAGGFLGFVRWIALGLIALCVGHGFWFAEGHAGGAAEDAADGPLRWAGGGGVAWCGGFCGGMEERRSFDFATLRSG